MFTPKIIALDLDGTLFSTSGEVTPYTRNQIRLAAEKGITVIISTGRPFSGLPIELAQSLGIRYAITANGSAVYRIADKACLHEDGIPPETAAEIFAVLHNMHLHLDAFIQGEAYTQDADFSIVRRSVLPEAVQSYVLSTRNKVPDLAGYILSRRLILQKATCIFELGKDGTFIDRDAAQAYLLGRPEANVVCGGYHDLEFTKAGVTKGAGLRFLCDYLQIPLECSMACGDSENDLDILQSAGFSVAMENADEIIKSACSYITSSCDNDGVGHAIAKFAGIS